MNLHRSPGRQRWALSLIELLIVIAIIAIVMSMLLVTFGKVYRIIESWK